MSTRLFLAIFLVLLANGGIPSARAQASASPQPTAAVSDPNAVALASRALQALAGGTAHAMATHNCWTDADWFFPAFSLAALASDPTAMVKLVGQEVHAGQPVYHLLLFHNLSEQTPDVVSLVQQVSAMDIYLDTSSLLPVAVAFNVHADDDANVNIPVEIRFAGYRSFNGVQAPTRIQKYLQNSLLLDLTVTNVAVNSGVSASVFTLPYVPAGGAQ
jgi:hypothetical protein